MSKKKIRLEKAKIEEKIAKHPGPMMGHGWQYWLVIKPSGKTKIVSAQANRQWDPWNKKDYVAGLPVLSDEDASDMGKGPDWRENILDFYATAFLQDLNFQPNDLYDENRPFGMAEIEPDEWEVVQPPFSFDWK